MSTGSMPPTTVDWIEVSDLSRIPSKPLVSIQMLAYNHSAYITDAIEGIVTQKLNFAVELVIGEDCSTDNTRELVLAYQQQYPHMIRVLYSNENVGFMENYRRIICASNGEFYATCEGDDIWVSASKLSIQMDLLRRNESVDMSIHPAYAHHNLQVAKTFSPIGYHGPRNRIIPAKDFFGNMGSFCPTASTVIRATAIKPYLDFTRGLPVGDYFRQCLGAMRGGAIYSPEIMCFYRTGVPDSWTAKSLSARSGLKHFRKMYAALSQFDDVTRRKFSKSIACVKSRQAWYAARGALARESTSSFRYYMGFVTLAHALRLGALSSFAKLFSFAPTIVLFSYKIWVWFSSLRKSRAW